MGDLRKQVGGFYFSSTNPTFHVVARIADTPGALAKVLSLLQDRINIIGSVSYQTEGGEAVWSGFVEPNTKELTAAGLKDLLDGSGYVKGSVVEPSDRGLLVDTFHTGMEYGPGRPGFMMPLAGFSRIDRRLTEIFGGGSEVVMLEEGRAMGKSTGEYLTKLMGADDLDWKVKGLAGMYQSIGWGVVEARVEVPSARYTVAIEDCFECYEVDDVRNGCAFFRGHISGTLSALSGREFEATEVRCRLKGDPRCEFNASLKQE